MRVQQFSRPPSTSCNAWFYKQRHNKKDRAPLLDEKSEREAGNASVTTISSIRPGPTIRREGARLGQDHTAKVFNWGCRGNKATGDARLVSHPYFKVKKTTTTKTDTKKKITTVFSQHSKQLSHWLETGTGRDTGLRRAQETSGLFASINNYNFQFMTKSISI